MDVEVVGCILSKSFHTAKFILLNSVKHRPDIINKYIIKGVMDIEWARCLSKLNQSFSGRKKQDMVAIFVNKKYIGTYVEFQEYLITHYDFTIDFCFLNYKQLIVTDVQNYYTNEKMTFVRIVLNVNNWKIGHIVIALLEKLAPKTCEYFKKLCLDKSEGYSNSTIHRIDTNNGFIQAGRILNQKQYLKKENYLVSHDRRGVLSLSSRHTHFNGPNFIISLRANSWMNNKYVAFGHVVEGERTLKLIETFSNSHRIFDQNIRIISCDIFPNYTVPITKTKLETALHSIIHKSVLKTLYIDTYGKLGPLQISLITDFQYMKSIVRTIVSKVLYKIKYINQDTKKQENDPENLKHSDSLSISKMLTSWDATQNKFMASKLKLYSNVELNNGLSKTTSPILRADRTIILKSKNSDTYKTSSKAYGIHLPINHKDYWKYKQIYESINK